jgi:hypothetical protein
VAKTPQTTHSALADEECATGRCDPDLWCWPTLLRWLLSAVQILKNQRRLGSPFGFRGGRGKFCCVTDLRDAHSLERAAFKMFVRDCFDEMSQSRLMISYMGMGAEVIVCAP